MRGRGRGQDASPQGCWSLSWLRNKSNYPASLIYAATSPQQVRLHAALLSDSGRRYPRPESAGVTLDVKKSCASCQWEGKKSEREQNWNDNGCRKPGLQANSFLFNLKGIKEKVHEECQSLPQNCGGQTHHHFDLGLWENSDGDHHSSFKAARGKRMYKTWIIFALARSAHFCDRK